MRSLALLILFLALIPGSGRAYETDQFNNRLEPLKDSTQALDAHVNQALRDIVDNWVGPRDEHRMVEAVFHRLGGYYWVDKIERWAMKSDEVDRLDTPRRDSIYTGHPFWATRVIGFFGIGPTMKINGQLVGSDKLGHFFSQGKKFYYRYRRYHNEAEAAERSAYTERAIFGQVTTGVYSNADLVANYEGYRFYRSLFEDNVIPGKPAILLWEQGRWWVQRPFTFADHVNAYWDEALNVNHFDHLLYPYMKERLSGFCSDYQKAPNRYTVPNEAALVARYHDLQLRDTSELRLDSLCTSKATGSHPSPAGTE